MSSTLKKEAFLPFYLLLLTLFFGLGSSSFYACGSNKQDEKSVTDSGNPSSDAGDSKDGSASDGKAIVNYLEADSVVVGSLKSECYKLPKELQGDKTLSVSFAQGLSTLVGGKHGLYQLVSKKLQLIEKGTVIGIVPWGEVKSLKMLIARANKIQVWDGTLQDSPLYRSLGKKVITTIVSRGEKEVWIGTQQQLWQLVGQDLFTYQQIRGVKAAHTFTGSKYLLLQEQNNAFKALRSDGKGNWEERSFSDEEKDFTKLLLAKKDDFWGFSVKNGLYRRKRKKDQAAWWAYRLRPNKDGSEKLQFTGMLHNPTDGTVWMIGEKAFYRLAEDNKVLQIDPPKGFGSILKANITHDGGLWANDGKQLCRLGQSGPPVTWSKVIQPFMKKNCSRCHSEIGGTTFSIETYEQTKSRNALIIEQIEKKLMPPDSKPLVGGDAEIFKQWLTGGFKK